MSHILWVCSKDLDVKQMKNESVPDTRHHITSKQKLWYNFLTPLKGPAPNYDITTINFIKKGAF